MNTQSQSNHCKLTPKQQQFCLEYIKDFNGGAAARRAGYSPKSAMQAASRLLRNTKVADTVRQNVEERISRTQIDADHVLQELHAIMQMSISDIFNDDWSIKPLSEWPDIWCRTLSGVSVREQQSTAGDEKVAANILQRIKWPDKLKTLEIIGKHVDVRAFTETHKHTHGVDDQTVRTLRDVIKSARRKEVRHGRTDRQLPV